MKFRTISILMILAIAIGIVSLWMGQQSYSWFPPQASAESILIDDLFSFLVTLGTFIFLGVVGTLTYSAIFQQAGKYDMSDGPHIEGNVTLEIVWTVIPVLLVIWIAGYSYQVYDRMSILGPMEHVHGGMAMAAEAPSITEGVEQPIEVHSRQWVWEFRYPGQNVTSSELHVPNNQRVKLALTSDDVIHGFYIPAFRIKQDIIPGKKIDFEFTPIREGIYRLRDSQYSGTYFSAMQTNVVVQSPAAYQEWLTKIAKNPPQPGYDPAFTEYSQLVKSDRGGWQTIVPAAPPLVNDSSVSESAS
ncbi:MAG: cytochrome c oxidase subunit II [Chamaesiphon sp. CSU_1_12]|nr:cytochrome c oxidase subunit II [Chamaesiphon sp. CSU_1_12]